MKILMIAPEPFFQPRGTLFSVLGRLTALSRLGHEVHLLTYHVGESPAIPGVSIFRIPSIPFIREVPAGPSWKKLILDIVLFCKALTLLPQGRYDLLHTHEEACFLGMILAKPFGVCHLYDMHSSLPEQLMNFRFSRFRPLIRLFEWLERRALRSCDAVITISPALDEHVKAIDARIPRVTIENMLGEGDPDAVSEEEAQELKSACSLDGKEIVLYTGTLEPYQGIDLLIAAAERVVRDRKEVAFIVVGGSPTQVRYYKKKVDRLGLSLHFRFAGIRPSAEIPRYIRAATFLVSPRATGTNSPLKIYSYLKSGKPIIATKIIGHTQVLTPEAALLVEPDPTALAEGILALLENRSLARELACSGRRLFESKYSFETFLHGTERALALAGGEKCAAPEPT